ncbi:MAG: ParA family protein [Bacteroidota bacterium]
MPTISIAIQKGGSAKTTTTINLGAALRDQGHKILLIDLDPQSNLTQSLGIDQEVERSIYDELRAASMGQKADLSRIIKTRHQLDVIPASLELASAELELVSVFGRENLLRKMLKPLQQQYDYILIDCPPALAMLTVNALVASNYVLMPLQAEFLPLKGVKSFMKSLENLKEQLNLKLDLLGIVLTKYDERKVMNRSVLEQLEEAYRDKVFTTRIRTNIALAQAQEHGYDIFNFLPNSNGAKDYLTLTEEILKRLN